MIWNSTSPRSPTGWAGVYHRRPQRIPRCSRRCWRATARPALDEDGVVAGHPARVFLLGVPGPDKVAGFADVRVAGGRASRGPRAVKVGRGRVSRRGVGRPLLGRGDTFQAGAALFLVVTVVALRVRSPGGRPRGPPDEALPRHRGRWRVQHQRPSGRRARPSPPAVWPRSDSWSPSCRARGCPASRRSPRIWRRDWLWTAGASACWTRISTAPVAKMLGVRGRPLAMVDGAVDPPTTRWVSG